MRATLKVITDMESLVVLTDCVGRSHSPELPSWVPDWTAQGQGEANLEWVCVATALYNASASQRVQATLFGDCVLGPMGIKVDTVMNFKRVESGLRETLRKWWAYRRSYLECSRRAQQAIIQVAEAGKMHSHEPYLAI